MNSGLNTGLFEEKHRRALGEAVWLYGWLVGSQTRRNGLVHGGSIFTYKTLHQKTGYGVRTIEKWLKRCEAQGYVRIEHTNYKMMRIWILKQKKYRTKQTDLPFSNPANEREGEPIQSRQPAGSVPASQRDTARQPAGFNKILSMSSNETPEAEEQETAAAFTAIGFDVGPFGQKKFQEVWVRRFRNHAGEWLTATMEATIQECQQNSIGVPPAFYAAKHDMEDRENAQFSSKYRTTRL
jgi:hypothetical protein